MESVNFLRHKESINLFQNPHPLFKVGASLSPYAGCPLGCVYCPFGFERKVGVKTDFLYYLEKKLSGAAGDIHLGLGSSCEPYCEHEKEFNITRNSVELVAKFRFPLQIFTKSPLVLRDIDLFRKHSENGLLAVSVSVMSTDEQIARMFEPGAVPAGERVAIIKELNKNDIFTGAVLAPIIPYISDSPEQLEEVFEKVKRSGGQYILPSVLSAGSPAAFDSLKAAVSRHFPNILHRIEGIYENSRLPVVTYTGRINSLLENLSLKYDLPLSIPTEKGDSRPTGIRQELLK